MPSKAKEIIKGLKNEIFRSGRIKQYQNEITDVFRDHFSNLGYHEQIPTEIISHLDHSVRFTGSTTNVFKMYLADTGVFLKNSFFLIQKSLRTQNAKVFMDDNIIPKWGSYFTEIGAITAPFRIKKLHCDTLDYLLKLGLTKDRIKINISSRDKDLIDCAKQTEGLSIETDGKNPEYYRHKYGLHNITGRNFNISIKNSKTEEFEDIGNVIIIEKEKIPIAAEMGFGVSTLLARIFDLNNSIEGSVISQVVPFKNGLPSKYSDALSAAVVMLRQNIIPGSRDKERLLRSYLKALHYFKGKLNLTIYDIAQDACGFEEIEFGETSDVSEKIEYYLRRLLQGDKH